MSKWEVYDFDEIIYDDTKNGTKVKKEHYLSKGLYPVIDQGKNQIAGYVNSSVGLYENVPAIIFGDHTRVIKYVDTPFFLGADGVKLLKCKMNNVNYKYLYYFFLHNEIPDTGYNRHYKWLKELKIPIPPLETQKQIAKTLDTVSELLALRRQQLAELDHLIKSIFYDMFGDPVVNEKGWVIKTLNQIAKCKLSYGSGSSAISYDGITRYIRITDINDDGTLGDDKVSPSQVSEKYYLNDGDILFARSGATVGKTLRFREEFGKCIYAGYLIRLVPDVSQVLPDYVFYYTKTDYYKNFIESNKKTVAQPNINAQQFGDLKICVPPLELQNQFAEIVSKFEEQKALVKKAIDETQTLFDSLMSQYFD